MRTKNDNHLFPRITPCLALVFLIASGCAASDNADEPDDPVDICEPDSSGAFPNFVVRGPGVRVIAQLIVPNDPGAQPVIRVLIDDGNLNAFCQIMDFPVPGILARGCVAEGAVATEAFRVFTNGSPAGDCGAVRLSVEALIERLLPDPFEDTMQRLADSGLDVEVVTADEAGWLDLSEAESTFDFDLSE